MSYHDRKTQVDIAILDFSKAFDVVPPSPSMPAKEDWVLWNPRCNTSLDKGLPNPKDTKCASRWITLQQGGCGVRCPAGNSTWPLVVPSIHQRPPGVFVLPGPLFDEDCLLYRPIRSINDQLQLQEDLNKALTTWANTWGMSFNPSKCYKLTTSQNRRINTFLYYLCWCVLSKVSTSKYLGVTLSQDLQWNAHIKAVCASASRTLGFLRRILKRCPTELRELAYRALVQSKLEYACSIWDLYLAKAKVLLENVQRRGACFIHQDYRWSSSVTNMPTSLGWDLLETRRREARLGLMDRIVGGGEPRRLSDRS